MTLIAYGTAINTALKNPKTKLEDLKALRDHAVRCSRRRATSRAPSASCKKRSRRAENATKKPAKKKKK